MEFAEKEEKKGGTEKHRLVQQYLREISRYPLLTREKEVELAQQMEAGHAYARTAFINANLRLVANIARGTLSRRHIKTFDLLDLIQEGNLGLFKAVDKFNWRLGYRFSTSAYRWIKAEIDRAIIDDDRTVRVPSYLWDLSRQVAKLQERYLHAEGRVPTRSEIATDLQLTPGEMLHLDEAFRIQIVASFDEEARDDDMVREEPLDLRPSPEDTCISQNLMDEIERAMEVLPVRDREILKMRFCTLDEPTLGDVGACFGLSRERIRQIQDSSIDIVRQVLSDRAAEFTTA